MSYSKLASAYIPADRSNYTQGRRGYRICKFTPHHMAGRLTAAQCGSIFQQAGRNASANYGIGYNGEIACYVDEENRAWTSSSASNDCQAITVEVANSSNGGDWPISDAAWNSLIELAVDVCTRYNFRLEYDGTPNGSLTRHNMFVNTTCPGPYLQDRLSLLADIVNTRLDNVQPEPQPEPEPEPSMYFNNLVEINTDVLNVRQEPNTLSYINTQVYRGEIYTIVETIENWGRLKSGAGWICLDYTKEYGTDLSTGTNTPVKKEVIAKVGLNVRQIPGGQIVKVLPYGAEVNVYETSNGWARIGDNHFFIWTMMINNNGISI